MDPDRYGFKYYFPINYNQVITILDRTTSLILLLKYQKQVVMCYRYYDHEHIISKAWVII